MNLLSQSNSEIYILILSWLKIIVLIYLLVYNKTKPYKVIETYYKNNLSI